MGAFRRRLVSGALALTVLQLAVLFGAPVSPCCGPARAGHHAKAAVAEEVECCPPGSHAPGECPLQGSNGRAQSAGNSGAVCRMMCDAPHGPQFLLGAIGVVPSPESTYITLTSYALHAGAPFTATARPSLPDAPPPRLL